MTDNLSLADIAAVTDKNDCGMWGGNSAWIIIFLIFAMMGGGGFWGGNGVAAATTADIQRAVDLNAIQRGQADIAADVQRTTYETIGAIKDAAYNNLGEVRDAQAAAAAGFSGGLGFFRSGREETRRPSTRGSTAGGCTARTSSSPPSTAPAVRTGDCKDSSIPGASRMWDAASRRPPSP